MQTAGRTAGGSGEAPGCLLAPLARARELIDGIVAGERAPGIAAGLRHQLTGGKSLRPALALWWGERLGVAASAAAEWGIAVELLHNAFLIRDDIEDGDRFRRDRPTLWVAAGIPAALNVADHLLAEAYLTVARIAAPPERGIALVRDFATTHRITVEGQALDLEHRGDPDFTLGRYEEIIRRKTGRYLALAWVGPARLAGWDEPAVELLWRIGDELGPAYQIRDDLLDLTEGKGRGGEIGCDIREGKPSILVAHALGSPALDPARRDRLVGVLRRPREETTAAEVAWTVDLFRELGSLAFAEAEARRRVEAARALYPRLPGSTPARVTELERIAAYIVDRKV